VGHLIFGKIFFEMADYASRLLFKVTPLDKTKSKCLSYGFMLANHLIHRTGWLKAIRFNYSMFSGTGIFAFLPVGQRVLDKLTRLIERELIEVGAQKCSFPIIGFEDIWSRSERWKLYGSDIFRFKDRLDHEACLQPTCEEMVTNFVERFGDFKPDSLPLMLFQVRLNLVQVILV
jgi:seryl-tRNA synthetase